MYRLAGLLLLLRALTFCPIHYTSLTSTGPAQRKDYRARPLSASHPLVLPYFGNMLWRQAAFRGAFSSTFPRRRHPRQIQQQLSNPRTRTEPRKPIKGFLLFSPHHRPRSILLRRLLRPTLLWCASSTTRVLPSMVVVGGKIGLYNKIMLPFLLLDLF